MVKAVTTVNGLVEAGLAQPEQRAALEKVSTEFSIRLTPHVLAQIETATMADPIFAQYVPRVGELEHHPSEISDPIGDHAYQPVKGVTHRYPDRVLLKPTHICQVYCRFCFRREKVGKAEEALDDAELDAALHYISKRPEIWEVVLSGGDPLVLSNRRLAQILNRLAAIEHVAVVRFHTRVPVVDPARIDAEFVATLEIRPAVYVVVHVNHAAELTPEVLQAFALMVEGGIPLLAQTVLLRGVNDSVEALVKLMRGLVAARVKPYYIHHLDKAKGTSHFRVPIKQGQELMRQLRGRISGLCQPTYVLDIPGGFGKVPIGPQYLSEPAGDQYEVLDYRGGSHDYVDKS